MQILSKQFLLPQNIKNANNKQRQAAVSAPSFKASKTAVIDSLSKEISSNIKLEGSKLKNIFADPEKRATFMEVLGVSVLATATKLYELLSGDTDNNSETVEQASTTSSTSTANTSTSAIATQALRAQGQRSEEDGVIPPTSMPEEIKFDTTRGVAPQVEKDFINYVNEKFSENKVVSDRLKLLFNKFGGHNRKFGHVIDGKVLGNKEILGNILTELKEANGDVDKISKIINKYQVLMLVESYQAQSTPKNNIKIEIPAEVDDILNRHDELREEYNSIIDSSADKTEAENRIKRVNELLISISKIEPKRVSQMTLKALKDQLLKDLETVALVYEQLPNDEVKSSFLMMAANKELSLGALKAWPKLRDKYGVSFAHCNELYKANISENNIEEILKLYKIKVFSDIKFNKTDEEMTLMRKEPITSFRSLFNNVNNILGMGLGENVSLRPYADVNFDKDTLINELKNDFNSKGKSTYPNIVKYLYSPNFQVHNERSFEYDYDKKDVYLQPLLDALNSDRLFDTNLFSPHSKLRFIERFVLDDEKFIKNLRYYNGDKTEFLLKNAKGKMAQLLNAIKQAFMDGVLIRTYRANDNAAGAQLVIPSKTYGEIKLTLDQDCKIHTIF